MYKMRHKLCPRQYNLHSSMPNKSVAQQLWRMYVGNSSSSDYSCSWNVASWLIIIINLNKVLNYISGVTTLINTVFSETSFPYFFKVNTELHLLTLQKMYTFKGIIHAAEVLNFTAILIYQLSQIDICGCPWL
jgi:hypothetical protein